MKYQRFVAYVYEYRKGKKENNCGFLRVEKRNGNVTVEVHIKCPGLPGDEKCNVYGFIRKAGLMEGVLLGSTWSDIEKLDCIIESEKVENNSWAEEFSRFGGIVILTEHGAFFGTEWDDQQIKPDNFEERKAIDSDIVKAEKGENRKAENSNESENRNKSENEKMLDMTKEAISDTDVSPEASGTLESLDATVHSESQVLVDTEESSESPEFLESSELPESQASSKSVIAQETKTLKKPTFCPFNDDEFTECRKISPNDFFKSCSPSCALRNNRFLEHGYYNFGHLIVGKRVDGKRILGVPGGYDQQERFMANMFGFPYFKESPEIQLPGGRGGYWYRLINSTDANQRNRFF